jgi:hypothetical protein
VIQFFQDTPNGNVYAAGQDDGSGLVGGIFVAPASSVTPSSTATWTSVSNSGVTTATSTTGYQGLAASTLQFAGGSMTPGQQYANVFRLNGSASWSAAADGIIGGNVVSIALPNAVGVPSASAHALAATTGGGIFKTTSGGQ